MSQSQIEAILKIDPSTTVDKLREEAKRNPVFNAVAHRFAVRERARHQITLTSLQTTMSREGYNFTRNQYADVLRFLSKLGIGKLEFDQRMNLRSLKDVKLTLQSVGRAAVEGAPVKTFPEQGFVSLQIDAAKSPTPKPAIPKAEPSPVYNVTVTVDSEGEEMTLSVPNKTEADIEELLKFLRKRGK